LKTLAMIKMEKNFVAVLEKGYPRKPYEEFSIIHLLKRLDDEVAELKNTIGKGDWVESEKECADISNIIDYIFEQLASRSIQI